jgi:hypothetical protein
LFSTEKLPTLAVSRLHDGTHPSRISNPWFLSIKEGSTKGGSVPD